MMRRIITASPWMLMGALVFYLGLCPLKAQAVGPKTSAMDVANIDVDAAKTIGKVSPYVFGQNSRGRSARRGKPGRRERERRLLGLGRLDRCGCPYRGPRLAPRRLPDLFPPSSAAAAFGLCGHGMRGVNLCCAALALA